MQKLIAPTVLILCPMMLLTGCASSNIAPTPESSASTKARSGLDNRTIVVNRLQEVGYSKEEAIARADKMSAGEIAYFGEHPESIKRSGFIILASLIGSSVWTTINNAQKKRAAYTQHLSNKIGGYRTEVTILDNDRKNETTLMAQEQDPAKRAEREANIKRLEQEVQAKLDLIKSLENEIELVRTGKQKVPKGFKK